MEPTNPYLFDVSPQSLIAGALFERAVEFHEALKRFIFRESLYDSNQQVSDLPVVLVKLAIAGPMLLLFGCFLFALFWFAFFEWLLRVCIAAVVVTPKLVYRAFLWMGRLCLEGFRRLIRPTSSFESVQNEALWDRWLDG